jgi:branched-chain amino acid transport system permease protein
MSEFFTFLVIGVVSASIYAVTAMGLVVTYNTTGVFNFAQGAFGMALAFVFWQLWQGWGVPPVLALAIVLLVLAPLLGALVERTMMRTLHNASVGISIVVTIGLLLLLVGIANSIWSQDTSRTLPSFLPNVQVTIGQVSISGEQLITVGLAVVVAGALRLFFKRTRTGVAMRAVVDDPELAALNGARPPRPT